MQKGKEHIRLVLLIDDVHPCIASYRDIPPKQLHSVFDKRAIRQLRCLYSITVIRRHINDFIMAKVTLL
jgi:hypothetical protein